MMPLTCSSVLGVNEAVRTASVAPITFELEVRLTAEADKVPAWN